MPTSVLPKALRLLVRVALVYVVVFAVWMFAAPRYHLFLGQVAAKMIPWVVDSHVDRVWFDTGVHYKISFATEDSGLNLTPGQSITADAVVDTLPFGYPIVTFLVLAIALPGSPWRRRIFDILAGSAAMIICYSFWITIAVYEYMSGIEIRFLQNNWVLDLIPPAFYGRYERGFFVFLGQVLPIIFYAGFLFRPYWKLHTAKRKPRRTPKSRRGDRT